MAASDPNKQLDKAKIERDNNQLNRLTRVIDVLYALLLFQIFMALPRPELDHFSGANLKQAFIESSGNYLVLIVGLVMIIIYWGQSNISFGNLVRSDARHAAISIIQIFTLLVYLYFLRFDVQFDGPVFALRMESIFMAIAGFLSVYSWTYAVKNGLVSEYVTDKEKKENLIKLLPEPIVALFSVFFAGFGPDIWTLSWLALIPVTLIVKRRLKPKP